MDKAQTSEERAHLNTRIVPTALTGANTGPLRMVPNLELIGDEDRQRARPPNSHHATIPEDPEPGKTNVTSPTSAG
ncbi:hypothetical protein NPIL_471831 [Nephila pilipes]|uniref:Uncharacterized protein n=1 Tax=Nephila pilipes TaxID=299642 RepID=A0A8X6N3Z7_NEPPI|nr:hypothetical protein NPIL_471831 [Nephila pilipes]